MSDDLNAELEQIGRDHARIPLEMDDLDPDPVAQLERWMREALEAGIALPNSMTLATADGSGVPSVRTVLLKSFDEKGLVFFTNYESRKARELKANPRAAVVLYWSRLERQVSARGDVEMAETSESDEYFATRPRGSQIAAWASRQSTVLPTRRELDEEVARLEDRFEGADVPRPDHWGGFRIVPLEFEFWQAQPNRLHDRFRYTRAHSAWRLERLAP